MCSACTSSSPSAVNSAAEQSARSLMFGLYAAAPQHRAHLLGDAGEPRDQDLQRRRVEAHDRSRTNDPRAERPGLGDPAVGHPHRAVRLGDDAGPTTARARRPGGPSTASGAGARRARPDRDDLDRRARARVPVASLVLGREVVDVAATVSSWLWPTYRQSTNVSITSAAPTAADAARASSSSAPIEAGERAGVGHDRTSSRARGDDTSPTAENTPARGGTITARMPSASAIAHACSGPAPPNATSASVARVDAPLDRDAHAPRVPSTRRRPRRRPRRVDARRVERAARAASTSSRPSPGTRRRRECGRARGRRR